MKLIIVALLTLAVVDVAFGVKYFKHDRRRLAAERHVETRDFPDMWFQQRLDHFDHTNTTTWKQRYQMNNQMYVAGGPILLMLGGEGPANAIWMTNGLWYDIAQKHNGLMYQLEHRFYGKSHPTPDTSVENLRFLSSEQALADAATFAAWIRSQYPNAKIYSFGGSYSGALSAWLRQRYPFMIDGAFSASGPYFAKVDFPEYEQTVQFVTETVDPSCFLQATTAIQIVQSMFQVEKDKLKSTFMLCDDLTDDDNDLYNLIETLLDPFDEAVQYGDDNREFEGANPPFKNANEVCRNMTAWPNALDGLAQVNRVFLKITGQQCLDASYASGIKDLQQTNWDSDGVAGGGRQWTWQTCTEFGYYQTIYAIMNMTAPLPLPFFLQQCSDIYGPVYGDPNFVYQSANNSNIEYGSLALKASNTIIFNGNYDPWSQLSITWPLAPNHETYTFFVPQAAHCAVLYPASSSDTLALAQAREQIMAIFDQWITGSVDPNTIQIKSVHA